MRSVRREGLEDRKGGITPDVGGRGPPNPEGEPRSQEERLWGLPWKVEPWGPGFSVLEMI